MDKGCHSLAQNMKPKGRSPESFADPRDRSQPSLWISLCTKT
ncbi:hypothetical protein BN134_3532 [Cronobacter dublinensis 1210]|uniref:Uncharacterized protein n=1 Tax=Cronobacter dublinensis 1210 TaxID=1208656 RepID=A0ABM9QB06_9ENTR|nr:hypothetical protein BN134_3532 [Cronobacter dublinensis 1210]